MPNQRTAPMLYLWVPCLITFASLVVSPAVRGDENAPTTQPRRDRPFIVFDALLYDNRPDVQALGMPRLSVIYAQSLWPNGGSRDTPRENAVRALARRAHQRGSLLCIDIEHWPLFTEDNALRGENLRKFQNVADWFHAAHPGIRLGFYSQMPQHVFHPIIQNDTEALAKWHDRNRKLDALARHVDVLFPSLYPVTTDPEKWRRFAVAKLKAAKRYNKQVYPFLMPTDFYTGEPLPGDYWRLQLETCREHADGLVIWGGYQHEWDPDAAWWRQTKAFLRTLRE